MGGLKTESFDDMYERVGGLLAKQQESGPTGFKHQLAEPRADLWVSQNIAAVFVGWSASMDGRSEFIHTVHLCTLHRQSDDILSDGNPWRISALVDMKHLLPEQPVPSRLGGHSRPVLLLPGAGATISTDGHAPETFMWPELIEHLQQQAQNEPTIEKRLLNCEARRCSDLGFVWAPFVLQVGGIEISHGVSVCSFRLEGGRWLISSLCETRYTK
ncbi:hypothetical protein HZ326_22441 [Fusarium oxysporum f. sp. albedinis]|nr:hypothetical protein HZ326_22441 [Fusarium oxysporum f. sp. albedinis]